MKSFAFRLSLICVFWVTLSWSFQSPCVSTQVRSSTKLNAVSTSQATRRQSIHALIIGGATALGFTPTAFALDMDAFINSQLEADEKNCDPKRDPKCKPTLSQDEALCKYGSNGNARGEACKRVKATGGDLPTAGSGGKSLGGAYAM